MIQGMDPAGRVAATDLFNSGADLSVVGEAGLKASQEATEAAQTTKRAQDIAEQKRREESKKSPATKKREAKTFGKGTQERRQSALDNSTPAQPTYELSYDSTPGSNKNPINWGGGKDDKLDYTETVALDKEHGFTGDDSLEKQWLDKYEAEFKEPYDIPTGGESGKSTETKAVDAQGNPPDAKLLKWKEENAPNRTLIFINGKWDLE
jgi:hypothetical protein